MLAIEHRNASRAALNDLTAVAKKEKKVPVSEKKNRPAVDVPITTIFPTKLSEMTSAELTREVENGKNLPKTVFTALKAMSKPPAGFVPVAEAFCVLLGVSDPSWKAFCMLNKSTVFDRCKKL